MRIVFSEKLLKSIPKEKYKRVLSEIKEFYREYLENNFNIRNMKHGWSVRKIIGTTKIQEIYKFRVNISDRILFTYGKHIGLRDEFFNAIVFLEFCNHDKQVNRGKNINSNEYVQQIFDQEIDGYYCDYKYESNESISRVVTTQELIDMIEGYDERAIYYLNDKQFELISTDIKPLFLFGSAGSGKTTISINKAYALINSQITVGYFTYSDNLVDEAKQIFDKIYDSSKLSEEMVQRGNVIFNCLNNYLLNKSQKTSIVTYEQFKIWVENILSKNIKNRNTNLQSRDVFREIRGIIKGIVPIDWIPIEVDMENLSEEFIDYLLSNKYAFKSGSTIKINNKFMAQLNTYINNSVKLNREKLKKDLETIYDIIDDYILKNKIIDENIYFNLPKEYSIFSYDEKLVIYDIAKRYQQWLDSNNKFDENDLTRIALGNIIREDEYVFDYIICDEIQDLTEIQIYLLMKIVKNKENILFCGDFNQTINPTFFNTGRVEALYKIYNGLSKFKDYIITTNYRSPKKVVNFANKITTLRIDRLGKNKKNDYFEKSVRDSFGRIMLLRDPVNKSELLSMLRKRAYVDIVVADDEEKSNLIKDSNSNKLVFTISDYKGLENEYIIGYNIISKFKEKWNDILHKNTTSNENELKYYFNLFYVLVTRTRNNLLLIEEDINEGLLEYFKNDIEILHEFDYKKLELDRISTKDEHYKKAIRLEKNKQYIEAIESYKNADLSEYELATEILRCNALYKMLEGKYKEASDELLGIQEYKHALSGYLKCNDYLNVIKCGVLSKMTFNEIKKILSVIDLDIIEYVTKYSDSIDWYDEFKDIYENHLEYEFKVLSNNVDSIVANVDNIIKKHKGR